VAVVGVHLHKDFMRYAVLEGTKQSPVLVAKDRLKTPDPSDVPALMDWYETQFAKLLSDHKPDRMGYRLTLNPDKSQLMHSEFPLGVLNLLAHKMSIPVCPYTAQSFTPSKLGLSRGTDLQVHCDSVFGTHPPYWDNNQKYAVLAAWFEL